MILLCFVLVRFGLFNAVNVDIPYVLRIIYYIKYYIFECLRFLQENRESGENPERYRRCKRGGRS